jgi:hypothetical protein
MKSKFSALVLASAVMVAAAMATVPAVAETSQTLNVPFSFTVGGQLLPAGTYSVHHDISGNIVNLQSTDASYHFTSIAIPSASDSGRVVLKFSVNGQTHALQTIQVGPLVTPRLDKKSRKTEDVTPEYVAGQ